MPEKSRYPTVEDLVMNGKILQELWGRQADPELVRGQLRRLEALAETLRTYLRWRGEDLEKG